MPFLNSTTISSMYLQKAFILVLYFRAQIADDIDRKVKQKSD